MVFVKSTTGSGGDRDTFLYGDGGQQFPSDLSNTYIKDYKPLSEAKDTYGKLLKI